MARLSRIYRTVTRPARVLAFGIAAASIFSVSCLYPRYTKVGEPSPAAPNTFTSDCLCTNEASSYANAQFYQRPAGTNKLKENDTLTIYGRSCDDLSVCKIGKQEGTALTGKFTMKYKGYSTCNYCVYEFDIYGPLGQ